MVWKTICILTNESDRLTNFKLWMCDILNYSWQGLLVWMQNHFLSRKKTNYLETNNYYLSFKTFFCNFNCQYFKLLVWKCVVYYLFTLGQKVYCVYFQKHKMTYVLPSTARTISKLQRRAISIQSLPLLSKIKKSIKYCMKWFWRNFTMKEKKFKTLKTFIVKVLHCHFQKCQRVSYINSVSWIHLKIV